MASGCTVPVYVRYGFLAYKRLSPAFAESKRRESELAMLDLLDEDSRTKEAAQRKEVLRSKKRRERAQARARRDQEEAELMRKEQLDEADRVAAKQAARNAARQRKDDEKLATRDTYAEARLTGLLLPEDVGAETMTDVGGGTFISNTSIAPTLATPQH